MNKDIRVYIEDILESIEQIEKYTKGLTKKDFKYNLQIQDAVIRRFEIIKDLPNFKSKILKLDIKS